MTNWKDAFRPVGGRMLPALAAALEDEKWDDQDRRAILAFYREFSADRPDGLRPLRDRLGPDRPVAATTAEDARKKATALAALAALGQPDDAWSHLVHTPDPTLRSYLIERLGTSGLHPAELRRQFDREPDVSARRALLLAIGGMLPERITDYAPWLLHLYEHDPDPGIHGAAGWVLRGPWSRGNLLEPIDARLATGQFEGRRQWYVSRGGPTFCAVIGPGALRDRGAGPPPPIHRFAVSATEVTVAQFQAFKADHLPDESVSPTPNCPVNKASWYEAAEYCNWLSERDRIDPKQWCYERTPDGKWEFVRGFQEREGYRLPTEAEWEYTCRAGARTRWHFGEPDAELAGYYACWVGNAHVNGFRQAFPGGRLKPSDWGFFDMHGNMNELCQESVTPQLGRFQDVEVPYRGGSYVSGYRDQGADRRNIQGRKSTVPTIGFRVVRTLPRE